MAIFPQFSWFQSWILCRCCFLNEPFRIRMYPLDRKPFNLVENRAVLISFPGKVWEGNKIQLFWCSLSLACLSQDIPFLTVLLNFHCVQQCCLNWALCSRVVLITPSSWFKLVPVVFVFLLVYYLRKHLSFLKSEWFRGICNFFRLQWEFQWENGQKSFFGNKIC